MAILPIIKGAENPILRTKTKPIKEVTKSLQKLLKDMVETMKAADGVGLAAPQVGEDLRVCIAKINGRVTSFISPKITWRSEEQATDLEGCLSLPNVWLDITRPVEIAVTYLDAKGKKQERKLKDFDARVVQHEVDHLNGVLIVDYVIPNCH